MTVVAASAPGKLVLLGEYAVLAGSPALVAAVDRRAAVHLAPGGSEGLVTAPQLGLFAAPLHGGDPRLRLVAACLGRFRGRVTIDTAPFYQGDQKLGLGSSAAVCVALCAARQPDAPDFARALEVHREVQGGGSGIDVAASFHGGILRYQRGEPVAAGLPSDLAILPVWTGRSASTAELVRRVLDSRASLEPLAVATARGLAALDTHAFLAAVRDFWDGLRELERESGAPLLAGPHERFADIAADAGAAYKPSGAGSGDLGLVFCDAERRAEIASAFAHERVPILPLTLGGPGVEVRTEP